MTGQPIQKFEQPPAEDEIVGYDPMTGQPIHKSAQSQVKDEIVGYDPMTGMPIYQSGQTGTAEKEIVGYDPMTGQPVFGTSQNTKAPHGKGKSFMSKVIIAGVAVVVVAGIVVSGVKNGTFLGPSGKVMTATVNTFSDTSHLAEAFDVTDILSSKSYTVEVQGQYGKNEMAIAYAKLPKARSVSGKVAVFNGSEVNFSGELTNSQLLLQIPEVSEDTYTYCYTEEKEGYLADILSKSRISEFDDTLEAIYKTTGQSGQATSDSQKNLVKVLAKEYKSLEFEKVSADTFEVDGKDRKCKGYETTITSDNLLNVLDAFMDCVEEEYDEVEVVREELEDELDELRGQLQFLPEVKLTFYLYKNKLACIEASTGYYEITIEFQGGKTRMQNMEISVNNTRILQVEGTVKGSKETTEISMDESDVEAIVEYDYKSGELEAELTEDDETMYFSGNVMSKGNKITVSVEEIKIPGIGTINLDGSVTISKGGKEPKFSGEKIDVGNMSQNELEDLVEDIEEYAEDTNLDSIL